MARNYQPSAATQRTTATTPMDAIRWVAIVPLIGVALAPFIVETHRRS